MKGVSDTTMREVPLNQTLFNQAVFSGRLLELSALRYTPSGMAVCTLELEHTSQIVQAGSPRTLLFTVEATALGEAALAVSALQLGATYTFTGFWAPAHYRSKRIGFNVLQVNGLVQLETHI